MCSAGYENQKVMGENMDLEKFRSELPTYTTVLMGYALSFTKNNTSAEDLVQDTFLKALRFANRFEEGTSMRAWLFTILRNTYLSSYRKKRIRGEVSDEFLENNSSFSTGLFEYGDTESKLNFQSILGYLACLPVDQCDALVAVGYLELSYEETAEMLDIVSGTVKSRVSRARDALALMQTTSKVTYIPVEKLKHATEGIPKTHKLYKLARAYEELYSSYEDPLLEKKNPKDVMFEELVNTGIMDDLGEDLPSCIQT